MDQVEICDKCTQRQGYHASRPESPKKYDESEIWQETVEEFQSEYASAISTALQSTYNSDSGRWLNDGSISCPSDQDVFLELDWTVASRSVTFDTWMEQGPQPEDLMVPESTTNDLQSKWITFNPSLNPIHEGQMINLKETAPSRRLRLPARRCVSQPNHSKPDLGEKESSYNKVIQKLKKTTTECSSALAEVENTKHCLETLTQQVEEMEIQAGTMESINQKLESELDRVAHEYHLLANETTLLESQNERLRDHLVETYAEKVTDQVIHGSQVDLISSNQENAISEWTAKCNQLQKESLSNSQELQHYKSKNDTLRKELAFAIGTQRDINTAFNDFRGRMNQKLSNITTKTNDYCAQYETIIHSKDVELAHLKSQQDSHDSLKLKFANLEKEQSILKKELDERDSHIFKLEDSLVEKDSELQESIATKQELQIKLNHMEVGLNESIALKEKLKKIKVVLGEKESCIADLNSQLDGLQDKLKSETKSKEESDRQIVSLSDMIQRQESQGQKLQALLETEKKASVSFQNELDQAKHNLENELKLKKQSLEKVDIVTKANQELVAKNAKMSESLQTKEEMIVTLKTKLKEELKNSETLHSKISTLEAGAQVHEEILAKFNQQKDTLIEKEKLLKNAKTEIKKHTQTQEALGMQIANFETTVTKYEDIIKAKESLIQNLSETVKKQDISLSCIKQDYEKVQNELENKKGFIKKFEVSIAETDKQLKSAFASQKKMSTQLEATEKELKASKLSQQSSQSQLEIMTGTLEHASKENKLLNLDNTSQARLLQDTKDQLNILEEEVNEKSNILLELQGVISFKNTVIADQENELQDLKARIVESSGVTDELQTQLKMLCKQNLDLQKEQENVVGRLDSAREKLDIYKRAESTGLSELESVKRTKSVVQMELDHLIEDAADKQKTIDNLKSSIVNYQDELEGHVLRIEDLRKSNRNLQSENDTLERAIAKSVERHDELAAEVESLEEMILEKSNAAEFSNQQLNELQSKFNLYKEKSQLVLKEQDKAISRLEANILRLEEQNKGTFNLADENQNAEEQIVLQQASMLDDGFMDILSQLDAPGSTASVKTHDSIYSKYQKLQKEYQKVKGELDLVNSSDGAEVAGIDSTLQLKLKSWRQLLENHVLALGQSSEDIEKLVTSRKATFPMYPEALLRVDTLIDMIKGSTDLQSVPDLQTVEQTQEDSEEQSNNPFKVAEAQALSSQPNKQRKIRSLSGTGLFLKKMNNWRLDAIFPKYLQRNNDQSQATLHEDEIHNETAPESLSRVQEFEHGYARMFNTIFGDKDKLGLKEIESSSPKVLSDKILGLMEQMYNQILQQEAELHERDEFVKEQAQRLEIINQAQ